MYDDYDLDYTFGNDHTLDEDAFYENYTHDVDDEDYARDGQDYESLAYRHYAWYNNHTYTTRPMIAQKRRVRVTLDIECYEDLDIENLDWKELLELEGDEEVHSTIQDLDPF